MRMDVIYPKYPRQEYNKRDPELAEEVSYLILATH